MEEKDIFIQLREYQALLEQEGYVVLYVGLYGSQNYNLHDEQSDYDVKAIVLPTLEDIIKRRVVSTTIETNKGSIDVKDLLTFYDVIRKGNFSYIEAMQSKYSIGDKRIKELFSTIPVNQRSLLGAMYEKQKAMTHEYPSKAMEFEKWGFDPKQLHHILRLNSILETRVDSVSFIAYPSNSEMRNYLIDVKRNVTNYSREHAENIANHTIAQSKGLIPQSYRYEPLDFAHEVHEYIKEYLKVELFKDSKIQYARQHRTFGGNIPKKDLEKFSVLEQHNGLDVSYIVYEYVEIL